MLSLEKQQGNSGFATFSLHGHKQVMWWTPGLYTQDCPQLLRVAWGTQELWHTSAISRTPSNESE